MLVPSVGSKVRLTIKNPHARAMIPVRPATDTFEGTVLKSYKWLTDQQFCLSGDNEMPIRVISMPSVEDIELLSGTFNNIDEQPKVFQVSGSKGNVYKIISDDGIWSCSCPAHGFGRGKDCKHIIQIKKKLK